MDFYGVTTEEWANQIRMIKMRELKELIESNKEIVPYINDINASSSITGQTAKLWLKRKVIGDVKRLKDKLELLTNKSFK